jgi:spore germination cell wall hydrolase CwlJ-like protein
VALVVVGGLCACAIYYLPRAARRADPIMTIGGTLSDVSLARTFADLDPAMLALARRHDPRPHRDDWGRVTGWERLDIRTIPRLGDHEPDFEAARRINAYKPATPVMLETMKPFVISGPAAEREKALHCLTQAVYFEAGFESVSGEQAVAQTVLNRVRHPGYPKSICGVVYEGSARRTGCQFSFTCDGSLERAINPAIWDNARIIAKRALAGFVMKDVGSATHYHADYVFPYWAPTLVKLKTMGTHIFYRWTGPSGTAAAFRGRYSAHETVSADILMGADPRTLEAAPPDILARTRAETLALAQASGAAPTPTGEPARIVGPDGVVEVLAPMAGDPVTAMRGGRRAPTPEDIARINKALASVGEAAPSTGTPPPPPAAKKKVDDFGASKEVRPGSPVD